MVTSIQPLSARKVGAARACELVRQLAPWPIALGLVIAQVAAVLARSRTSWFAWLCVSSALFGFLSLSKVSISRRETKAANRPEFLKARCAPPPNLAWNWFTLSAMTLILLAGLVKAPHRSDDVYAYGAYGQLVSEHSVSPYVTRPSAFPDDPVIARMAPGWQNTRSVYGPLFTAVSAVGMRVAGTSALLERLWFQLLAALATGASALLLKRRCPQHWWLFALNPVTLLMVSHEAHNDAFVGLGILSALLFLERAHGESQKTTRFVHCAIASLVLAASIKITAILAVPALAVWIVTQLGWKRFARIGAAWALVCIGLFAATGGPSAFGAFRGLRTFRSTTSLWHLDVVRQLTDRAGAKPGMLALTIPAITLGATGLVVVMRCLQLWQIDRRQRQAGNHSYDFSLLATLTITPLVVFITLGLYILPWYWGWLLAPAVLLPARYRPMVLLSAATHTVSYGAGTQLYGTLASTLQIARFITPLAFVVTLVAVAIGLFGDFSNTASHERHAGWLPGVH